MFVCSQSLCLIFCSLAISASKRARERASMERNFGIQNNINNKCTRATTHCFDYSVLLFEGNIPTLSIWPSSMMRSHAPKKLLKSRSDKDARKARLENRRKKAASQNPKEKVPVASLVRNEEVIVTPQSVDTLVIPQKRKLRSSSSKKLILATLSLSRSSRLTVITNCLARKTKYLLLVMSLLGCLLTFLRLPQRRGTQ